MNKLFEFLRLLQPKSPPWKKGLKIAAIVVGAGLVINVALFGSATLYAYATDGKIASGVYVLDLELSGLPPEQAEALINRRLDQALAVGFRFRIDGEELTVGRAADYLKTDVKATVAAALRTGRESSLIPNTLKRLTLFVKPKRLPLTISFDSERLNQDLRTRLADRMTTARNAKLQIAMTEGAPTLTIEPERVGRMIDFGPAVAAAKQQAEKLKLEPIALQLVDVVPELRTADVQALAPAVPDWLSHAPFKLTAFESVWTVKPETLAGWISVTDTNEGWSLALDPDELDNTLKDWTGGLVQEPVDGKLVLEEGKVKEFVAPQEGISVNPNRTIEEIMTSWANGSTTVPIVMETISPKITGPDAETMGIQEILGVGRSNYSGSPVNRRKNITHGADVVHGTLIEPGENFSLLKTLGKVDGSHGWLPELVIKGDKTTPEFGGGLCQIGTTVFRSAINSGLPITERRNHSYRVRYYEPAGTDATIYEPAPDLRFLNDTGHWILITTRNIGSDLTFTFWGTDDGRKINVGKPRIYNIVAAPPKKIVETTAIPPGTTKCTESAHAGATASLDYDVTYPDGHTSSTAFLSYYKPWGAVCLTGVVATSTGELPITVPLTP